MSKDSISTKQTNFVATRTFKNNEKVDNRRLKTKMIEEIKKELKNLNINMGNPVLQKQCAVGKSGNCIKLSSNVYGIKMKKIPVFRYDITISATYGNSLNEKKLEFTKRSREDAVVVDRKNMSRITFLNMQKKHPNFFGTNPYALYYDLQCILYTLTPLKLSFEKEKFFILNQQDCSNIKEFKKFNKVEMIVKKVRENFELTLGDLSHLNNDCTQQNYSLAQFLELATSQSTLFNPQEHVTINGGTSFLMDPSKYGFTEKDGPNLGNSKYLGIGSHKSIRFVEGPKGRGNKHAALVVEVKKTPFHQCEQTLIEKAADVLQNNIGPEGQVRSTDVKKLHNQFKMLHIQVRHGRRPKEIRINGVKEEIAATYYFNVEGKKMSLMEYYELKYNIKLRFPRAPLASAIERGKTNFFPLELCYVIDCQRANFNQLNFRDTTNIIRACAVSPNNLKKQIEKTIDSIHLRDSQYLEEAGIQILAKPLEVDARHLPPPKIIAQHKKIIVDESGKFQLNNCFLVPAKCKKWGLYFIPGRMNQFGFDELMKFGNMFIETCRQYGMEMPMYTESNCLENTTWAVENAINNCKKKNCNLVFFITEDSITNLHNFIKHCEQKYEIVTQDLKMKNAFEIVKRSKTETMRNIVLKTNEKLGGLNYSVTVQDKTIQEMISDRTLFIGLGISHSGVLGTYERARKKTLSIPSVIGFAANLKTDPFDFVGDYCFDEPRRDEKFTTIKTIVENCMQRFKKSRGNYPKRIILYRNGTPEGQFGMCLQYEVPLIRFAIRNLTSDCKITMLVSQRAHNIRLFTQPIKPWEEFHKINFNIKPGTVVDTQLTHPEQNEFYLNSHSAIKGSARTPRYTVLIDESNFTSDVIQNFTYALAYAHQIVNSPTSLPAPVYIASLYAKRGRALYAIESKLRNMPTINENSLNYQAISNELCYSNTSLIDQRVNA